MLLRVQTENALFELRGQQKSAGLVVDETKNRRIAFYVSFFQISVPWLCSNRALNPAGARKLGKSRGNHFQCPEIPRKYLFSELRFQENKKAMGYLKGKSRLMIYEKYANMKYKYKYGNRHFWCRGYYVSTVGRNRRAIEQYIRNQLQEDYTDDQMSIKEYIDPFTGRPSKEGK